MSILGNRVLRREDPELLTGGGSYTDDLDLEGAVHVTFLRSPMARARVAAIDVEPARTAPGVLGVFTAADLEVPEAPSRLHRTIMRPVLAGAEVRYVGEPVVAIVTEERYQGPDAAELVYVDYEPLDEVVSPEAAIEAPPLLDELESNVVFSFDGGDADLDFGDCEVVVELETVNQRVAPSPIEGRAATAEWVDGRLVMHISCQGAHAIRDEIRAVYGLDESDIRVRVPDVGGSFGAKSSSYPETWLVPWLARAVGRPVKWADTRSENMLAMGHGRGQKQRVTIGGTRDGRVTHYALDVIQDVGAYPAIGAFLPYMTRTMTTGVYAIENARYTSRSVLTNTTPTVAYRGAGRPEATAAIERAIDRFARAVDLDPAEVRRRNFIPPDAFPYTTPLDTTYDTGDYPHALDVALETADYPSLREEQQRRRRSQDRKVLGVGLSAYVEITALEAGSEHGSVEIRPDGSVLAHTGSTPYGQGHRTTWAMIISEELGIPLDRIEIRHGDTDEIPRSSITGGSRSVQLAGSAVHDASVRVAQLARERAAEHLEANADDVTLDKLEGRFHVVGTPAVGVSWAELAGNDEPLRALSEFEAQHPTFPFGVHVAVVEVDVETGEARLVRHIAVDDAGTLINPMIAAGQVHGGIAQGAAQALYEQVVYDEFGNPQTANFADYAIISAAELPSFELAPTETPTPENPLGAKGIGEAGTIGATPAVQNAVVDAIAHLGVDHVDMPCTPERIWRAIQEAR